jgi:histidinol-phosphatase (PHP family)
MICKQQDCPHAQIDLFTDGHIHTRLCNHANGEMEDYVKAATRRGLKKIIFLEHFESDIQTLERIWLREKDFEYYFTEGKRLKKKYQDSLEIILGIEAGFNPFGLDNMLSSLKSYPCEHVGLSYHFLFNGKNHLNMVSRRQESLKALAELGIDNVLTSYFEGLQLGIESLPDIQVVCHLDAVMRHYPNLHFKDSHWHQIEKILATMTAKNIAFEINTSGFAIPGSPYPKKELLRMAQQKNIIFIAGSDAHCPEQVGRFFDKIPALFT